MLCSIIPNIYFFIYSYNCQIYGTFVINLFKAVSKHVIIITYDKKERGVKMKKLKQEYLDKIDEIVAKHKDEKGPMKLMLHEVQDELGYVPFEAMEKNCCGYQCASVKSLWSCNLLLSIYNRT